MDYFNNIFTTFLALESGLWRDQKALRFHQKYLNFCSEDEQKSYSMEQHVAE